MSHVDLPNLASVQLGSKIVYATDEWFAAAENMISDAEPVWKEDAFTTFGKWMDGWESRRRRTEGHDWCIVKLGLPGIIKAIEVDTGYFTGNFSPKTSIYGATVAEGDGTIAQLMQIREQSIADRPEYGRMGLCATAQENELVARLRSDSWKVLVPLSPLGAGYEDTRRTLFMVDTPDSVTHIRVNMGPDGGITRLKVFGEVVVNPSALPLNQAIDLAAVEVGGCAIACSNKHYGHPRNLIAPGRGECMGDGWETARQPARPHVYEKGADGLMVLPGYDWALLKLGLVGTVDQLEIDTHFFKGNYPESCMVEACLLLNEVPADNLQTEEQQQQVIGSTPGGWKVMLPRVRLGPDEIHVFNVAQGQLKNVGAVSHLKVTIYPDGGIMRIRARGCRRPDTSRL